MSIKTISSRIAYQNKWSRMREDIIERANGEPGLYGVLDKDPACIIIPLQQSADGGYLTLVHQFRYTVGGSYFEFPQGGWKRPDVVPEDLARGELQEETGLSAGKLTLLGSNWIAYGAMNQRHYVWLAEDLTQGGQSFDEGEESITVHRVSVAEFEAMILDGRVMDNCTLAAWATYLVWNKAR